jgi:opacity protein-like surface antigen
MQKAIVVALLVALFWTLSPTKAQETSKVDLYGGYDYVRYNASPRISGVPPSESANANGLSGQFTYSPYSLLSLVAELSGYAVARQAFNTTYQISYLFGPRVKIRRGKITPFAQVLLGRVWAEDGFTFGSVTAFGMTGGGGIDLRVTRHMAIRLGQAEYLLTKFADGSNNRQNNFRFGTGIVLRFGEK